MEKEVLQKEKREKPLYSLPSNLVFLLKKAWQMDKGLLLAMMGRIPTLVLLPLLATYLSKFVVEFVTTGASAQTLIACILTLSGALLVVHLLDRFFGIKIEWRSFGNRFSYINLCSRKIMDMDYEHIEHPDILTKMQKSVDTLESTDSGTQQVFLQLVTIASNIIGLLLYSALIFTLSPWLLLLLCCMTVASYCVNTTNVTWTHRNKDHWVPMDRKRSYILKEAGDFEAAKDVRVYGMSGWFSNVFQQLLSDRLAWIKKSEQRGFAMDFFTAVLTFLRDGVAYGFLIDSIAKGRLSAAAFVLYFGLITQYSNWLLSMIRSYHTLQKISLAFCDLREFLDFPDGFHREKGVALPVASPTIAFENVSFRYPKNEKDTLRHLSFTLQRGEKLALVGLNGAGKTTLVKLLCGLYRPTEGTILIDGQDLRTYNRDAYYTLLSVVFQDIFLMPISIAKNITLCTRERMDHDRLDTILKLSGLYDKVQTLPQGENTLLLKGLHEEATDLSGGEAQKIALARALYKGGKIIVLDEPTAALDPIAENEMYQKYNELTRNATSVFISHRLSSTRFCDHILFLQDGEIVEEGTHDTLMQRGGKYAHMFDVQSHYYKENTLDAKGDSL